MWRSCRAPDQLLGTVGQLERIEQIGDGLLHGYGRNARIARL
jgi:hypothetical protein